MARFRPPSTPASPRASEAWARDRERAGAEVWAEVGRYASPVEAELARGRLQCAGIDTCLHDLHTVSMAWHLAHAMGGIRLSVPACDEERARELLDTAPEVVFDEATAGESSPQGGARECSVDANVGLAAREASQARAGETAPLRTRRIMGWVLAAAVFCLVWRRHA